jgi:hypothetical protein
MTEENTNLIRGKTVGQLFGSLGGKKTLQNYGKDHFKNLSKKGVLARLKKGQIKKTKFDTERSS